MIMTFDDRFLKPRKQIETRLQFHNSYAHTIYRKLCDNLDFHDHFFSDIRVVYRIAVGVTVHMEECDYDLDT